MSERQDVITRPQILSGVSVPRWLRVGALLAGYALILVGGHFAGRWVQQSLGLDLMNLDDPTARLVLGFGLVLFIVLLAIPFVPGIEVCLALFAIFGAAVALPIYLATIVALTISYVAGRCVALDRLAAIFDFVGLRPASEMVRRLGAMAPPERVSALVETAPNRIARLLVHHRDLTLIAAVNMPGNALIGGGGGIALIAGMSGMFRPDRFLLATAIAALPVPLLMVAGGQFLK